MPLPHALDNPIWSALNTRHARFAVRGEAGTLRYPREICPFVGSERMDAEAANAVGALIAPGEGVYGVGEAPALPPPWRVSPHAPVVQMVWERPGPVVPAGDLLQLGAADLPDMLQLTALVFPEYFRTRTPELGDYWGLRRDGRLAAMTGERMAMPGFTEISAVCTHPDFEGRGFAGALVEHLVRSLLVRGERPFLHVGSENVRARSLYTRLGFVDRVQLPLWRVEREGGR